MLHEVEQKKLRFVEASWDVHRESIVRSGKQPLV